jgi:hypothetical protein
MSNLPTTALDGANEAATTGSRGVQQRSARRNTTPLLKETDLHGRHRLLIEYMVFGVRHQSLAERVETEPGQPLTPEQAARLLNRNNRWARRLLTQPAVQRLLARETEAFRTGAKARAWRKVDELVHEPGDGKAADRKVQLQAASQIIGEPKAGTTVNVQTNVGVAVKAGVLWKLPDEHRGKLSEIEGEQSE